MDDRTILSHIRELVAEERTLRAQHIGEGLDEQGQARLLALEEDLDRCWDLLRQRRAKKEFGEDPNTAKTRPANEVESYLQ